MRLSVIKVCLPLTAIALIAVIYASWNRHTQNREFTIYLGGGRVYDVDFSPDGKSLAICSGESANTLSLGVYPFLGEHVHVKEFAIACGSVEWSTDGNTLITTSWSDLLGKDLVTGRSVNDWQIIWTSQFPDPAPVSLNAVCGLGFIAIGGVVSDWEHEPFAPIYVSRTNNIYKFASKRSNAFSIDCRCKDGQSLIAVSYDQNESAECGILKVEGDRIAYMKTSDLDISERAWLAIANGGQVVMALTPNRLVVLDAISGKLVKQLDMPRRIGLESSAIHPISAATAAPLFAYTEASRVVVRRVDNLQVVYEIPRMSQSLCLSDDGKYLAAGFSAPCRVEIHRVGWHAR